jgi:hypothetical protein
VRSLFFEEPDYQSLVDVDLGTSPPGNGRISCDGRDFLSIPRVALLLQTTAVLTQD